MTVKYYWDSKEISFSDAKRQLRMAALVKGCDPDEANAMLNTVRNAGSMEDVEEVCDSIFELSNMHLEIDFDE